MDSKLKKKFSVNTLIAIVIAAAIITSSLIFVNLYEPFELKTLDLRFQIRGPISQREDILFIEMDEGAIQDLGRWPWPRDVFARIVQVLERLGAKAILFDVTFTEPSQLFIDKESLNEGLRLKENKKMLQDFIDDMKGAYSEGEVNPADINDSLSQIHEGLNVFEEGISETLKNAIKDKDLILAQAVKNAQNVYIGYKAEVIHDKSDIERNTLYPKLKNGLKKWAKEHPKEGINNLPANLKDNQLFDLQETSHILKRMKIYNLLNENLELKLEEVASSLGKDNLAKLRPDYNSVKREVYRDRIKQILNEDPLSSLKELVWSLEIFDARNIQILKEEHEEYVLHNTFSKKVSIPYNNKSLLPAINISPPILSLVKNMKNAGFLNAIPDNDGVLRKIPLFISYENMIYPHITLWILFDLWQLDIKKDLDIKLGKFIKAKDNYIPIDKNGYLLINWAGKWADSFRHISCSSIYRFWQLMSNLESNLNISSDEFRADDLATQLSEDKQKLDEARQRLQDEIKNSICIIGLTAPGTHDYNPISLQPDYPMVGTHANVLNTILNKNFLHRANLWINLIIVILLSLLAGVCIALLAPLPSLACVFFISVFYFITCVLVFNNSGLWVDMVRPLLSILLSYIAINSYNFATEEKEKRWIRRAFGHYISKNVMEEILKDPAGLKLGGERKELSVLFSDIRSFTTYSEKRQPEEVVTILNEYLDEMTKIIFKYNGTLDKYVGDEIMAIFGAPAATKQTDHAERAVRVALEMLERLKELQKKWQAEGKEPLDIGIGINTGPMLVGNMGSTERMDYTVIGDSVNLGARVEALTRDYNNHLIVTEFTYDHVKDLVEAKRLDAVKVKGKDKPVVIYEIISMKDKGV